MVSKSRPAVNLKEILEPRVQAFVNELKRLGLDHSQIYFYFDEDTRKLMVATLNIPEFSSKAVMLTDHNTEHAGLFLAYHFNHQTCYHALTGPQSLSEALKLALDQGWDVQARTVQPPMSS